MASPKAQLSPPLAGRELDGEVLLEELNELRRAKVSNEAMAASVRVLMRSTRASQAELQAAMKSAAAEAPPALGQLLRRWSTWVKGPADVAAVIRHAERLSTTGVILQAIRRAGERLR